MKALGRVNRRKGGGTPIARPRSRPLGRGRGRGHVKNKQKMEPAVNSEISLN